MALLPNVGGGPAGGLDVIKKYYVIMPADLNAAFVMTRDLRQYLESLTARLLYRYRAMTVSAIPDHRRASADHSDTEHPDSVPATGDGMLYRDLVPGCESLTGVSELREAGVTRSDRISHSPVTAPQAASGVPYSFEEVVRQRVISPDQEGKMETGIDLLVERPAGGLHEIRADLCGNTGQMETSRKALKALWRSCR